MKKSWKILSPDPREAEELAYGCGCHPIIGALLINRGIRDKDEAEKFLNPSFYHLHSPFLLKDMDIAVERISTAIFNRERILIFGDYDVDGVSGTALLLEFLTYAGADVTYYLPNRFTEGYGLSTTCVQEIAVPGNIALIITVDCGTSSLEAVKRAHESGIDVIITDHHEVPDELPPAFAILNPKQPGCPFPFSSLSGVGVVFNLVLALRKHLREKRFWDKRPEPNLKAYCDFVALGTVADIVPLKDENRILVKGGLDILDCGERPGITALKVVSGIAAEHTTTWDIAFRLAPRINAAGRLDHASTGLELLRASDEERAQSLALRLNEENTSRQAIENNIISDVKRMLAAEPDWSSKKSLVLAKKGWHEGVIGIVASRLVELYYRPVVLIALTGGMAKGSARSIEGFNLYQALEACGTLLERFGGHEAAGGLYIRPENIHRFRTYFEDYVRKNTRPEDFQPKLVIDSLLSLEDISMELLEQLEKMAPFGPGNPEPLFASSNIDVIYSRVVGTNHLQLQVRESKNPDNRPVGAIIFNAGEDLKDIKRFDRIAYSLRLNRWKKRKSIQMVIKDFEIS